mmetsp:Transcript_20632/g.61536  ORF Transcript_20632/g.61536 Transcript_20632/m.61536 type:complete len:220 (-) Transcript_20632:70-729(-)
MKTTLLVALAFHAASPPARRLTAARVNPARRAPIVFFHLHKAGGSSFCHAFRASGLRTARANCNCPFLHLGKANAANNTRAKMRRLRLDVCAIEAGRQFPTVDGLRHFASAWRARGGRLATCVRDPWERFRSNYFRELAVNNRAQSGALNRSLSPGNFPEASLREDSPRAYRETDLWLGLENFTIEDFAAHGQETPNGRKWGAFNRPNFYARARVFTSE